MPRKIAKKLGLQTRIYTQPACLSGKIAMNYIIIIWMDTNMKGQYIAEVRVVAFSTLSAHARESYSSLSVCLSVCLLFYCGRRRFQGWNLQQYILGDDLSVLNVALFWKSKLFWRKSEWNFGRNCSDLLGQRPVIKRFCTWSFSMSNPLSKLSFFWYLRWFLPFV